MLSADLSSDLSAGAGPPVLSRLSLEEGYWRWLRVGDALGQDARRCWLLGGHELLTGFKDLAVRGEAPARVQAAKERGAAAQPTARPGGHGQGLLRGRGCSPGLPGVRVYRWQAPCGGPGPVERAHCVHQPGEGDEASAGWLRRQIGACRCHRTSYSRRVAS